MNKKSLFLGFNWKLNPASLDDTQNLLEDYTKLNPEENLNICVFPPAIYLHQVSEVSVINPGISFGPQVISSFENGAYTGEVSILQAKDLGSNYALIGHSETRKLSNLSDNDINAKVKLTLKNNLIPVVCIGYSKDKGLDGVDLGELKEQLEIGLEGTKEYLEENGRSNGDHGDTVVAATNTIKNGDQEVSSTSTKIIIAYEPVWAIGSGKAASKEQVKQVLDYLKSVLDDIFSPELSSLISLVYGGSVDETNCSDLLEIPNLQGFLIGGASLKPEKIAKIVNITNTKL